MRKLLEIGGYLAGVVLIVFGVVAIAMSFNARDEVRSNLSAEKIVGTPDAPKSIANKPINTGEKAREFAKVMREHALKASDGKTYAEMGRFLDSSGNQTSDESKAAIDPDTKKPVENGARNLWVTETALSTALNVSYMAENLALFGVIVGIALLLAGIGFFVLTAYSGVHRSK